MPLAKCPYGALRLVDEKLEIRSRPTGRYLDDPFHETSYHQCLSRLLFVLVSSFPLVPG
jgi:hypothetical protein